MLQGVTLNTLKHHKPQTLSPKRCQVPASNITAALDSVIAEFGLNDVQASVLKQTAPWLSGKPIDDPIELVWGA